MDKININGNMDAGDYEVAIVGGGVIGTALLYVLSRYTDLRRMILLERRDDFALVSSHFTNNSQTLHFGDIETNYTLEKATQVKAAADLVKQYLLSHENKGLYYKNYKMVLAVGDEEVRVLEKRHEEFRELFPNLKKLGWEEIEKLEPNLTRDRDRNEKILALYSEDGFAVNYQALAKSFVSEAQSEAQKKGKDISVSLRTEVASITKKDGGYEIACHDHSIAAETF